MTRARRYKRPFSVIFTDVDNFKSINDTFGHHAGDALLRVVAATFQNALRAIDIVARLGGDEFIVLLPETGEDVAFGVA